MAEKGQKPMFIEYKENINIQAEVLVTNHFPKKILELDILLQSSQFSITNLPNVRSDVTFISSKKSTKSKRNEESASKKRKLSGSLLIQFRQPRSVNGSLEVEVENQVSMPSNSLIISIIDQLKPHIQELVDSTNVLKLWILLLIPKIEDGNNFGVEIQEETLAVIEGIEVDASSYLNKISKYFLDRGDIVTKIADDPYVEDFKRAVMELDEKEFLIIRHMVSELRNHYTNLHNHITKNLEKIKKPRTSNADNLY